MQHAAHKTQNMGLVATVEQFLAAQGVAKGAKLLLALSGGADSTALLYALCRLRASYHYDLTAAHLNHLLRGEESLRDEQFVRNLCQQMNVPLIVERCDVAAVARETGNGLEEAGRRERYAFLARHAKPEHSPPENNEATLLDAPPLTERHILTAHTASDQAETVLFHLIRGSGTRGLAGIPAQRGNILRPLLTLARADIEAFCAQEHIDYITDSSNADTRYTRNHLRAQIIPQIKTLNPSLEQAVLRLSATLRLDDEFFALLTDQALAEATLDSGYALPPLRQLHPAVLNRVCIRLIETHCDRTPSAKQVDALRQVIQSGGKLDLYRRHLAFARRGVLVFELL